MFRLQFKYSKQGILRFLSHLEVARALERALRRAELPLIFSQGFSPHLRISYGPALSVGVASRAEYADVLLDTRIKVSDFVSAMKKALPPGLEVLEARYVDRAAPSLQSQIGLAAYEVEVEFLHLPEALQERVDGFLRQKEIMAAKKEGGPSRDVLSQIHHFKVLSQEGKVVRFQMGIKDMEKGTVKPEVVIKALAQFCESGLEIVYIERTGLFVCEEDSVRELW